MALMKFRESNRVKWVGSRPGHDGTQIIKFGYAVDEINDFYTVTAGKTLFLTAASFGAKNTAGALATGSFRVYFIAAISYQFGFFSSVEDEPLSHCCSFVPPMEVPAGGFFRVFSSVDACTVYGSICGWEE